jgi:dolichol-phosphate mannosyltransferase
MEPDMRTLVTIPTYNEADNLGQLVAAILAADPTIDVLVVDDNSPDGTGALADALAAGTPRLRVLHRAGKLGLGSAYVAGFQYALAHDYERIVVMDADFSHRPEDLPRLLRVTRGAGGAGGADVVIGSRNIAGGRVEGWSPLRQMISKGGSLYARLLLGLPLRDCTSGFKCFQRAALEALDLAALRSNGYAFNVEMNYACVRAGLQVAEVPIVFPDRTRGTSKMTFRIVLEAALLVLRLRLRLAAPALAPAAPHTAAGRASAPVALADKAPLAPAVAPVARPAAAEAA